MRKIHPTNNVRHKRTASLVYHNVFIYLLLKGCKHHIHTYIFTVQ